MKLTCSECKFTLTTSSPEEETAYRTTRPMHCAMPMVIDGEKEVAKEEPKEEKKGFFGLGKSKKKK